VAPPEVIRELCAEVDRVVCLLLPDPLFGIGAWYEDFRQVADEEVIRLLEQARARPPDARRGFTEHSRGVS
jgi:putative phosphoribosyl transferase